MNNQERIYWLIWSQVSGVGPTIITRLKEHFGLLSTAWQAAPSEIAKVTGIGKQLMEKISQARSQLHPEKFFLEHSQKNPLFWTPADPEYPRLLLEIHNYPAVLYYRGVVDLKENLGSQPLIGIVGTRSPSEYGKRWTHKISKTLAENGFTIISGLAAGIDTFAHIGCLQGGARTIAVFGTGLDEIYPKENTKLAAQICEQGLILSEYPVGTKGNKGNFPQRNRIVAGLSRAVLVMEAPEISGALITARQANEFGRDVYVLPGRIDDQKSMGCLKLIDQGGHVILSENDLLERLGAIPKLDQKLDQLSLLNQVEPETNQPPLSSPETPQLVPQLVPQLAPQLVEVLGAIEDGQSGFDAIVYKSNLDAGTVSSALLQLELIGLVTQLPGMRYQKN